MGNGEWGMGEERMQQPNIEEAQPRWTSTISREHGHTGHLPNCSSAPTMDLSNSSVLPLHATAPCSHCFHFHPHSHSHSLSLSHPHFHRHRPDARPP